MRHDLGGISGSRASTEPFGLGPPGIDPGRKDFTIADVLAWARTKPARGRYDYSDQHGCALCVFLVDTGRASEPRVALHYWNDGGEPLRGRSFSEPLWDALIGRGLPDPDGTRWTFGALAQRLKALCPETPLTKSDWLAIDAYMAAEQVSA